jgi:hypothetical protein
LTTYQNLAKPECEITITHDGEPVTIPFNGTLEITLPILSRGIGGAKFRLQNFDAEYTGVIAKDDPILILLQREGDSETPVFGGRITKLTNLGTPPEYWIDLECMDYGQQLQNPPVLVRKWYTPTLGKTILKDTVDLCPDLSSTTIDEANDIATYHSPSYDEVLPWTVVKEICDAVTCNDGVKGVDGYVNAGGGTVMFERGKNTSPVSLTNKVLNYTKSDDVYRVKNSKIKVYGAAPKVGGPNAESSVVGHKYPNADEWTTGADSANWVPTNGAITFPSASPRGGNCLRYTNGTTGPYSFLRMHDPINPLAKGGCKSINFWIRSDEASPSWGIKLLAPDTTNYFLLGAAQSASGTWASENFFFGPTYEYDATLNPTGIWQKNANADWTNIQGIQFFVYGGTPTYVYDVDGLFYGNAPFQAETDDSDADAAASIAAYGAITMEPTTVDNLSSDYDCLLWAKGLRSYYLNPVTSLNLRTFGDNLFTPGDMQPLVLVNDAISDSFRILEVVHTLQDVWWETKLTLSNEPLSMDYWVRAMWEKQLRTARSIGKF